MKYTYKTNPNLEKVVNEIVEVLVENKIKIAEMEPVLECVKFEIYHNTSIQISKIPND